ncbi:uncharacterized protein VTP21DRAFT_7537 [Calcarisporiella thermophila]|uniref:uncharacterized protein n=1 Tax=Calcarisporiella thermophila TaxID=911321 RepID=UPI003743068D
MDVRINKNDSRELNIDTLFYMVTVSLFLVSLTKSIRYLFSHRHYTYAAGTLVSVLAIAAGSIGYAQHLLFDIPCSWQPVFILVTALIATLTVQLLVLSKILQAFLEGRNLLIALISASTIVILLKIGLFAYGLANFKDISSGIIGICVTLWLPKVFLPLLAVDAIVGAVLFGGTMFGWFRSHRGIFNKRFTAQNLAAATGIPTLVLFSYIVVAASDVSRANFTILPYTLYWAVFTNTCYELVAKYDFDEYKASQCVVKNDIGLSQVTKTNPLTSFYRDQSIDADQKKLSESYFESEDEASPNDSTN